MDPVAKAIHDKQIAAAKQQQFADLLAAVEGLNADAIITELASLRKEFVKLQKVVAEVKASLENKNG